MRIFVIINSIALPTGHAAAQTVRDSIPEIPLESAAPYAGDWAIETMGPDVRDAFEDHDCSRPVSIKTTGPASLRHSVDRMDFTIMADGTTAVWEAPEDDRLRAIWVSADEFRPHSISDWDGKTDREQALIHTRCV